MKKFVLTLMALSCLSTASLADQVRWQTQRIEVARAQNHGHSYQGGYGHRHHGGHWAPWLSMAALGTTVYLAQQYTPPPATVYVSPPVVMEPPRVAYFCQTVQQYYPNTPTCPVPWQLVPY